MRPQNKSLEPDPRSRHHGTRITTVNGSEPHPALGWRGPLSLVRLCGFQSERSLKDFY